MPSQIRSFDCCPTRSEFACGFDEHIVRIFDQESQSAIGHDLIGTQTKINKDQIIKRLAQIAIKYSNDGSCIASTLLFQLLVEQEKYCSIVIVWDVNTQTQLTDLLGQSLTYAVVFSPDNQYLMCGGFGGKITIWDWKQGIKIKIIQTYLKRHSLIDYSSVGTKIIYECSGGFQIHSLINDKLENLYHKQQHSTIAKQSRKNGRMIIQGSLWQPLRVWKVETSKLMTSYNNNSVSYSAMMSPDSTIITLRDTQSLKILDRLRNKLCRTLNGFEESEIKFSYDSKCVILCKAQNIKIIPIHFSQ